MNSPSLPKASIVPSPDATRSDPGVAAGTEVGGLVNAFLLTEIVVVRINFLTSPAFKATGSSMSLPSKLEKRADFDGGNMPPGANCLAAPLNR